MLASLCVLRSAKLCGNAITSFNDPFPSKHLITLVVKYSAQVR